MTFKEVLAQVLEWLQHDQRLSYRAVKRQFSLNDDYFEDLKDALLYAYPQVSDDGRGLVWTGDPGTDPAVTAAPAVLLAQAPLAYTPPYLAEKILTSKSALAGERKQVTVLFADLKGSTELIRDLDPEEARTLLDPALHVMMDAVHRYEGTVNQVLGDGIMALFGAPVAHEDHAAAGVLRRPGHAGGDAPLCGGRSPRPWPGDAGARGAQLGRSRGAGDWQRPAHGLLGGGSDHASGRAHGAARHPRQYPADGRDPSDSPKGWSRSTPLGPFPVKGLDGTRGRV